jgi:sugar lactone lactonase YvrE
MSKYLPILFLILAWPVSSAQTQAHPLTVVYQDDNFQITGVSVSKSGRVFINFPRWSDRYLNAVGEVMPDGSTKPYPDEHWNRWDMKAEHAGQQFVCVQSVVVDDADALWVLDPAVPLFAATVPGGPKLIKIDLNSNQVERVIAFGSDVVKPGSYLNDVRFDNGRKVAYITDSGVGGLVVLDLKSGKSRRVLDGHPSVLVEPGVKVAVDGKELLEFGKPPQFQADSIALSPDGDYLYYKPITAKNLYRIKTSALRDASLAADRLAASVEKVAEIFPTDGFWMDKNGNLYLSDVTHNAVARRNPNGKVEQLVSDPRLQWPDTFSEGPDGAIYITASHINESPRFNQGKSVRTTAYGVFKFNP